jgi:hypothetical protein
MDMARPGLLANLVGIMLSTFFAYTLGNLVYGLSGDAPEWAKFSADESSC